MAKIKFAAGVTPILNEHSGFTFQPNHYGQSMFPAQKNDRKRYPTQHNRMQNIQRAVKAWRELSPADQLNWQNVVAAYPQPTKNPDEGYLTAYQNFVKRNQYVFLNYGIDTAIMTAPEMSAFSNEIPTYSLSIVDGRLILTADFPTGNNDLDISIFMSRANYESKQYQNSQARYMGVLSNSQTQNIRLGCLYNGYAIEDARNMSPPGWHIPSRAELQTLVDFVGGAAVAGLRLKDSDPQWWASGGEGQGLYDFNIRGTGARSAYPSGEFFGKKEWCGYSFFEFPPDEYDATYRLDSMFVGSSGTRRYGNPVRYIKDDDVEVDSVTGNDGRIYTAGKIGSQVWSLENSCETEYQNHDLINYVGDQGTWDGLMTGARCFYNNDQSNAYSNAPVTLDVTDLYLARFGILPSADQYVRFLALPISKTSNQFFDPTKLVLPIT